MYVDQQGPSPSAECSPKGFAHSPLEYRGLVLTVHTLRVSTGLPVDLVLVGWLYTATQGQGDFCSVREDPGSPLGAVSVFVVLLLPLACGPLPVALLLLAVRYQWINYQLSIHL